MAGPPNWNEMTLDEQREWRAQRVRELEEKRARRAPKRQRRAEIREVNEEFAQADDPPDNPPWEAGGPAPEAEPAEDPPSPPAPPAEEPEPEPEPEGEPEEEDDASEEAEVLRRTPLPLSAAPLGPSVPRPRARRARRPPVDRDTLLAALSAETRDLLSDDDIEQILEEERARAADEQKRAARTRAREEIRHRMRVEHGLLDAATLRTRAQNERLKTKVRIRFDLPGDGAGHTGANGVRIDGRLLAVRTWHTVSVAEYESIREMHYNAWINETQFKTLDQASRFGITTMNRLQGTTPARAIFAQQPNQVEIEHVAD